jgi:hypothetical protein
MKLTKTEAKLLTLAAEYKADFIAGSSFLPVLINAAGEYVVRVPVIGSRERDAVNALVNAGLGIFEYNKFASGARRSRKFWGNFVVTFPNA